MVMHKISAEELFRIETLAAQWAQLAPAPRHFGCALGVAYEAYKISISEGSDRRTSSTQALRSLYNATIVHMSDLELKLFQSQLTTKARAQGFDLGPHMLFPSSLPPFSCSEGEQSKNSDSDQPLQK